MERNAVLWTLVAFFGGTVVFQAIQRATEDEHVAVTIAAEVVALAAIVAFIVLLVRRRRD